MSKKYKVRLTAEERTHLTKITTSGEAKAKEIAHARILLATDDTREPKLTVTEVAERCDSNIVTVQQIRRKYAQGGVDAAVKRKKRETPPVQPKITGDVEAHIIALACGEPPKGYSKWSLRLLAGKTVEMGYVNSISHTYVGEILKKHSLSLI
jgi:hypothetical protein